MLFNLLGQPEKLTRDVTSRLVDKDINRAMAMKFGFEYFDGPRAQGYGGYTYDGRWQAVAKLLIEKYHLSASSRFLDVGCAKGFLMHDLRESCPGMEVQGLDISEYAKQHAMETVRDNITLGNCYALPYPDDYFDASVAINTIHNLDVAGCRQAIRELMRVTRHKANIFIQVDAYNTPAEKDLFEIWMLTAKTYLQPGQWEALFDEVGYKGDYFWTIIGFDDTRSLPEITPKIGKNG